ncbi:MAG: DUF1893 domain-containing protein [Lentisphaeria bacterium]|nr:DUF1893 domain-containing protein [Lentisphaeria bacterium]
MRLLLILLPLFLVSGCASATSDAVSEASQMIRDGKAECVLVRDNRILYVERGRGVSPLLNVYDHHRAEMEGAVVVDKVIGRAAACIAICGKVKHVHGEIMSEDAVEFLKENGITAGSTLLVPRILNRKRDGLCPLEKSVEGIRDPEKALTALRAKIEELSAGMKENHSNQK